MKFDDFLGVIGEFGPYQRRVYGLLVLPVVFTGIQIMAPIFIMDVPAHRCKIPGLHNDTYAIQSEAHGQLVDRYIPRRDTDGAVTYAPCTYYADAGNSSTEHGLDPADNTSRVYGVDPADNSTTVMLEESCQQWVYDRSIFSSTAAAESNLVCDRKMYVAHAYTIFSVGSLCGFLSIGTISDRFGRKTGYMTVLTLLAVFSTWLVWLPNIYVFIVFRFITGFGFGGSVNGTFVYIMEFLGPSKRTVLGIFVNNFWSLGMFLHVLLAWLLRDWRHLQLATGLPFFLFAIYFWIVPESPRWLLAKGHTEKGMATLRRMAKANSVGISEDEFYIDEDVAGGREGTIIDLFRDRKLAAITIIVFFNWTVVSMQYYGLTLNVSNLAGDLYLNYLYTALVECAAYNACIPALHCAGRKTVYCVCMLVGGAALLLAVFPQVFQTEASQTITLVLSLIGKFGSSAAFATIYLFSVELFPTVLRNCALGASAVFSGLGTILCPYVVELANLIDGPIGSIVPLVVFGLTSILGGLLSLLLPETRNRRLPDTIHDMCQLSQQSGESWAETVEERRRRSLVTKKPQSTSRV